MAVCLLAVYLRKDDTRFSRWANHRLSDAQRDYACLDALASVLLYEAILAFKDPIASAAPEPDNLVPGLVVSEKNVPGKNTRISIMSAPCNSNP